MIISTDDKKSISQNSTSIYGKTLNKVHVKGMNLYITKAICDKSTANIIF